ncbi:valine dehydrogenase [Pseudonocardia kujensis]|uniref:Glu/Leu/Phe/Val family dehydrogenase n=1 Tax=Pseudonocardia kujensis TaxID=1128675 RepID=UPI001E3E99D1|nr:Glu/Leu/Phe/Val dehydrogenase dimerization domain-containing protein [Pseudonocardia kujensis]MCE0767438.1 valine dehydrogenase [Pseudonocardia kujensis]
MITSTTMPGRFGVFDNPEFADSPHERVLFCHDRVSGLRCIIAIHSLALGPAVGGCRMYPYADEASALLDVLRLSRGMTFKAAGTGLDHGGGKAVIIGDPHRDKSPGLFEAFGRFVDELGGRYITAGDAGTDSDDMDVIGRTTGYVAFRTVSAGGSGDSGPNTALGVLQAMRAGAQAQWGTSSLVGRTVGVEGLGKVGSRLAALLVDAGATVIAGDIDERAVERVRAALPTVRFVRDVSSAALDIYAPCALGGTVNADAVDRITARLICGGANNQLSTPDVEQRLTYRGALWVPDFLASAGGLIQAAAEIAGQDAAETRQRVEGIFDTVERVVAHAAAHRMTTGAAARELVLQRIRSAAAARALQNT